MPLQQSFCVARAAFDDEFACAAERFEGAGVSPPALQHLALVMVPCSSYLLLTSVISSSPRAEGWRGRMMSKTCR